MSSTALLARRLHGSAASAIPAKPAHAMPASRAALPGYLQARLRLSQPGDALEQEAERAAEAVARGEAPYWIRPASSSPNSAPMPGSPWPPTRPWRHCG